MNHRFFIKFVRSVFSSLIIILSAIIPLTPTFAFAYANAAGPLDVWWPTNSAQLSGTQPFKAMVEGLDVSSYDMYWQVDGGQLNQMSNNSTDYPHKESSVDVSGWNWHGTGPYAITFVAKQNGSTIETKTVSITVSGSGSTSSTNTSSNTTTTTTNTTQQTAPVTTTATTQTQTQTTLTASPATTPAPSTTQTATPTASINVWWPTANATISGVQPFKANVPNYDVNSYTMYWQVDGGQLNQMSNNSTDYPHKESSVDLSGWNWQSSHIYKLTFTAKDSSGTTIATQSENVTVNSSAPTATVSSNTTTTTNTSTTPTIPQTQPTTADPFYINPNSSAAQQANTWQSSDPIDAAKMQLLANEPTAVWFGGWNSNIQSDVSSTVTNAANAGKTALLVAYNISNRDCGGYSAGGTSNYISWIQSFANGIGNRSAWVILEPDALAQSSCLSSTDQATRFSLLSQAVSILKQNANTRVYIDAGHSGWIDASTMAGELQKANIAQADGFSLNVSNYNASSNEIAYGQTLSSKLGGKHFVIDTSRNGNGSNGGQWCNVSGSAIGSFPTTQTGVSGLDAYLWAKVPGESDGTCNGGPSAGTWWSSFALSLVNNR